MPSYGTSFRSLIEKVVRDGVLVDKAQLNLMGVTVEIRETTLNSRNNYNIPSNPYTNSHPQPISFNVIVSNGAGVRILSDEGTLINVSVTSGTTNATVNGETSSSLKTVKGVAGPFVIQPDSVGSFTVNASATDLLGDSLAIQ